MGKARGALPWPGGKSWLVPALLKALPEHRCYCEVFGGGAALLLNKPRSEVEVYNDAKDELVTLFRCARYHRDELLAELELVLNSRIEFQDLREQAGFTDIQRSARWFYRVCTCFGGNTIESFGVAKVCGGAGMGSRTGRLNKLAALSQRLDRVCIEHLDWQDCLDRYDAPTTLFFLDPPYTDCNVKIYSGWSAAEMNAFASRVRSLKARWIITVNDSAANRSLFEGFKVRATSRPNGIENRPDRKKNLLYRELVISK